ncbi:MAG: helicase [Acidimicrobiales bacterium]|nr:helicase [Acidimicrobiales bacterium]
MSLAESQRERPRPIRRGEGRVPPHNLNAEESLLGALLLSRDAVGNVAEMGLSVGDFYKPAHQYVYDAIRGLSATGNPIDAVTVADELRRAGLLEEIGGAELLLELQNATPAISNATRYAKIVQDTAVLRRLIGVAAEIAEIAYNEPDDVSKALDEAETKVFEVAEDRVTDSVMPLGDLMPLAMDKLQETYERGDIITGLATGYNDLDEVLSGLQPSTLNIVGARPAMGKCVAWDTPMVDPQTGEIRTAQEWYRRGTSGDAVGCVSLADDGHVTVGHFAGFYDDGAKPLFRVTTRSGRSIRLTAAHPLLTGDGWKPVESITVGATIAVPTSIAVFGSVDLTDDAIDALASRCVRDGRLHAEAFVLTESSMAGLLGRLFAGTAWVTKTGQARIVFETAADQLGVDVAHLLLRFGIRSRRRDRFVLQGGVRRRMFEVGVLDAARFCARIGVRADRAEGDRSVAASATAAAVAAAATAAPSLDDGLPMQVWDDVLKAKSELTWADVNRLVGRASGHDWNVYRRRPRRETVALLGELFGCDVLRRWASPDVSWDPIVSIEPAGVEQVYDFNVPGTHNFVAADVFVHNTAFGLGMAVHAAMTSRLPVLVFSLEMGHAELTQRILSSEARVDSSKLRNGKLTEADWTKLGRAVGRLEVPLYLDDNPRVTVMEIRAKARRLKSREGLGLIVIDYLQLMSGSNSENRQLEVSEISRGLKVLARELQIPIVALSQLSRNLESRGDKRPMLADLRESGSLEQDADVVMFLYRDEVYNPESPDKGSAEIIIAKHRSGPIGMRRLAFLGAYTRFDNMARNV